VGRRRTDFFAQLLTVWREYPDNLDDANVVGTYLFTQRLAEEAVLREPVSTPKFPANREMNRGFCGFKPSCTIFAPGHPANSMAYSQIPYVAEQGIGFTEQGSSWSEQG